MIELDEKPTYYVTPQGRQVTYIEHAAFISAHSYPDPDREGFHAYPMLQFEDKDDHFLVTLTITGYKSKPEARDYYQRDELARQIIILVTGEAKKRGYSMTEVSRRSGLSQTYLSDIVRGVTTPTVDVFQRIMRSMELKLKLTIERIVPYGEDRRAVPGAEGDLGEEPPSENR